MKKQGILNLLISNIIAIVFGCSLSYSLTYSMNLGRDWTVVLAYCAASILIFNLFFANKWTKIIGSALIIGFIGYKTADIIINNTFLELKHQIKLFLVWIHQYCVGAQYIEDPYVTYLTLIICFSFAFVTYRFIVKRLQFGGLFTIASICLIVTYLTGFKIYQPGVIVLAVCGVVLYAISTYGERYKKRSVASIKVDYQYGLWAIPLAAVLVFTAASIARKSEFSSPDWLTEAVFEVSDWGKQQDWAGKIATHQIGNFDLKTTGFQSSTQYLGGNITLNHKLVLTVKSDHRVYLRGSIPDQYTGGVWKVTKRQEFLIGDNNVEEYITDNYFDNRKFLTPILLRSKYKNDNFNLIYENLYPKGNVTITHNSFSTNTLFNADHVMKLNSWNYGRKVKVSGNAEMYFGGRPRSDSQYSYEYRVFDRESALAEELLKLSSPRIMEPILENSSDIREKYNEILDILRGHFQIVDYKPEPKGAWVTLIYCKNES